MVWVAIPSAEPANASAAAERWRAMGYQVAVLADPGCGGCIDADVVYEVAHWRGYPAEVSDLMRRLDGDVVVAAGDDMDPDGVKPADDIAAEFADHFPSTVGIMQPTGDDWMDHAAGRICGSPWVGRAWIDGGYRGRGTFWPEYQHYYADEELCLVAERLGILWRRPDLTQTHHHWSRLGESIPAYMVAKQARWSEDKRLFEARRDSGFPEHLPTTKGENVRST